MRRVRTVAALALASVLGLVGGCGSQGGVTTVVNGREANGEPVLGAGDGMGWSLHQSDRSVAQAKAAEQADRALASHPE